MDLSSWTAINGDPTIWGWLTVVAYLATAALALRIALILNKDSGKLMVIMRQFWWIAFSMMVFLGINKQLDLQSLVTLIVKQVAIEHEWYENRRAAQQLFILVFGVFCLGLLISLIRYFNPILKVHFLAISGIVLLTFFVAIRATSFHHMDKLIGVPVMGTSVNFILEVTGIFLIAVNALLVLKSPSPR